MRALGQEDALEAEPPRILAPAGFLHCPGRGPFFAWILAQSRPDRLGLVEDRHKEPNQDPRDDHAD